MEIIGYNRRKATAYAQKWALSKNPEYYYYHELGGDCTNFVSQCIYAGSGIMNYTPTYGWYYINANNKSPSWTGTKYLYNFLVSNQGLSVFGKETDVAEMMPGDVIQLGDENMQFYHSLIVVKTDGFPAKNTIYVASHSYAAYMKRLSDYDYKNVRFIHIEGVRIP